LIVADIVVRTGLDEAMIDRRGLRADVAQF
jgi:hypothetical protein